MWVLAKEQFPHLKKIVVIDDLKRNAIPIFAKEFFSIKPQGGFQDHQKARKRFSVKVIEDTILDSMAVQDLSPTI